MAAVTEASYRPTRWARGLLPVRVAIGMWTTQALIGPLYLALPGVSHRHVTPVLICSAVCLAWAALNFSIPNDPRLGFLYPLGGASAIASVAVLVASTGGASSPLRASQLFFIVFAAWFLPRRMAVEMLVGAMAVTLLPVAYDRHADAGAPLGWTIMLMLTFLVVGGTILTARVKLESLRDRARVESLRDPLTGIANRRALQAHFRRVGAGRRESDRFGIVLIDLDGFKEVNTRLGHAGGDRALTIVAEALRDAVREDDLVARIGGDEFVIVANRVDDKSLATIAARAIQRIAAASDALDLEGVALGASAGVSMCPDDGASLDELLAAADGALGEVKADAKGQVKVAVAGPGAL